jgi:hypothetical protein
LPRPPPPPPKKIAKFSLLNYYFIQGKKTKWLNDKFI